MEETLYLLAIAGMEASIIEGGKAAEDAGMRWEDFAALVSQSKLV